MTYFGFNIKLQFGIALFLTNNKASSYAAVDLSFKIQNTKCTYNLLIKHELQKVDKNILDNLKKFRQYKSFPTYIKFFNFRGKYKYNNIR